MAARSEHLTLVGTGAFAALDWLEARFAGTPAPNTCATGGDTTVATVASVPSVTTFVNYLLGLGPLFTP